MNGSTVWTCGSKGWSILIIFSVLLVVVISIAIVKKLKL